jgi:hypothetical protein
VRKSRFNEEQIIGILTQSDPNPLVPLVTEIGSGSLSLD